MWLMALQRIPEHGFSPLAAYPLFHPPLYPYFLAALGTFFGSIAAIRVAQAAVSSLLAPILFRIAERMFGVRAAWIAGVATAFWPELIWYSAHFWCETLFLSLMWFAIERVLAAGARDGRLGMVAIAGVTAGLATLTRETLLYLIPLGALWLWTRGRSRDAEMAPRKLAIAFALSAFATVAPWTVRNAVVFQTFVPVSTGGGLNLYQGNAPLSRGEVYDEYYANEGRIEQYKWARTAGLKVIWDRQPQWIFEKLRDELPKLFELDSLALIHMRRGAYDEVTCRNYRAAAVVLLMPWLLVLAASCVAASRLKWTPETSLLVGLLVAYVFLHVATHGFSRYRLPILPAVILLGSSLASSHCFAGRTFSRRLLLLALALTAGLVSAPSFLDQLGYAGFTAPPPHEGFTAVCP